MNTKISFLVTGVVAIAAIVLQFSSVSEWAVMAWCLGALCLGASVCTVSLRIGISVTAAICALANGYLLNLKLNPPDGSSLCTVNSTIDCLSVNSSSYSVLFDGSSLETPITLIGLGFFLPLIVAGLMGAKNAPRLFQVTALFGFFNVLVSIYLLSALISSQTFCVFCVSIYVGNLILLVASLRGMTLEEQTLLGSLDQAILSKSTGVLTIGFAIIVGAPTALGWTNSVVIDTETTTDLYTIVDAEKGAMMEDGTEPTLGQKGAPYTVLEFADYGCPHCADASAELKRMLKKRKDIQVRFKVFPLSGECNPTFSKSEEDDPLGVGRCFAATAAECAHQQGAFWEMSHDLFSNQAELAKSLWNLNDLMIIVDAHNMNREAMESCLRSEYAIEGIVADATAGGRLGLDSTPTFFLKGVEGDKWVRLKKPMVKHIEAIVDAHISSQAEQTSNSE